MPIAARPDNLTHLHATGAPPAGAPAAPGHGLRMAHNSLYSLLRLALLLPLPLLIVPFMLARLGAERFGVYAIVALFASYTQLADFGLGLALTKFSAEFVAQQQWARLDAALNTILVFYFGVGLLVVALVLPSRHALASLIPNLTPTLRQEVALVIGLTAIAFALNLTLGAFNATLQGLQRMDITNLTALGAGLGLYLGIFITLSLGGGLIGIALLSLALALAAGAANAVFVHRLIPTFRLRPAAFDPRYLRSVLRYSLNIQGSALTELLFDPFSKLVITRFLGVALVAQFEVGQRIITQLRAIFAVALQPLLPGVSHLHAAEPPDAAHPGQAQVAVQRVYARSVRYVYLFGWPAYLLLIVMAPWLLHAWLGPGYADAAFVMRLLTCAWFVSLTAFPPYLILQALGHAHLCLRAQLVQGLTNLTLALLLVGPFGLRGVVTAACMALLSGSLLVIVAFAHTLQLSPARLARAVPWRAFVSAALCAAALWLALTRLPPTGLLSLAALAVAYGGLYTLLLLALRVFDQSDQQLLCALLPARLLRRHPAAEPVAAPPPGPPLGGRWQWRASPRRLLSAVLSGLALVLLIAHIWPRLPAQMTRVACARQARDSFYRLLRAPGADDWLSGALAVLPAACTASPPPAPQTLLSNLYFQAANRAWSAQDWSAATALYRTAHERDPQQALPHRRLAEILLYRDQQPAAALAQLVQAQALDPHESYSYMVSAHAYLALNDPQRALQAAERALAIAKTPYGYMVQGQVLIALARWPQAIASLQASLALDDRSATAYLLLGNALHSSGDPAAAQAAWQEAKQRDPSLVIPTPSASSGGQRVKEDNSA